jgi:positive regulator of sigma E activity
MKWFKLVIVFLAPMAAVAAYVALAPYRSGTMDWVILGAILIGGVAAVWLTPWHRHAKIALSLGYVPIMGAVLVVTAFATECSIGSCL